MLTSIYIVISLGLKISCKLYNSSFLSNYLDKDKDIDKIRMESSRDKKFWRILDNRPGSLKHKRLVTSYLLSATILSTPHLASCMRQPIAKHNLFVKCITLLGRLLLSESVCANYPFCTVNLGGPWKSSPTYARSVLIKFSCLYFWRCSANFHRSSFIPHIALFSGRSLHFTKYSLYIGMPFLRITRSTIIVLHILMLHGDNGCWSSLWFFAAWVFCISVIWLE